MSSTKVMKERILITGADGYIGLRLTARLLATTDLPLHLWVRADSSERFEQKLQTLDNILWRPEDRNKLVYSADRRVVDASERLRISYGELTQESPFANIEPDSIAKILHSAAVTRFNVEPELAQAVNAEGANKLYAFARGCENLERIVLISSVYASGLTHGHIGERLLPHVSEFANHYERSKWLSEQRLGSADLAYLPWIIARVATVITDDMTGSVSQYNAVHNTLKLFYYGMLSLVPGTPTSPLYFVTGEFVVDSLMAILADGETHSVYNIAYERKDAIELGSFIKLAFEIFSEDPTFKKRRILPPLFSEYEPFKMLADSMESFGQSVMSQASGSISPFARQLFVDKHVANDRLQALLKTYEPTNAKELVGPMCRYLVESKWGRSVKVGIS